MGWAPVELDEICRKAFESAQAKFAEEKLLPEDVGLAIYAIRRPEKTWVRGGFRGEVLFYPASVIKSFFLAYTAHQIDVQAIVSSAEFERAAKDMIKDSNNDATGYIVDRICGTTPGPELDEAGLKEFADRRLQVNRWFDSLGYSGVNAVNRTFNEGPYGRERQWVGEKFDNRNRLSADHSARLMADVALERHWSPESSAWMKGLFARANPQDDPSKADGQAKGYIGRVLPAGAKLFSKAGWTSDTRHDSAWVVMPDGREFGIGIMTTRGKNLVLVSYLASEILGSLGYEVIRPEGDPEL